DALCRLVQLDRIVDRVAGETAPIVVDELVGVDLDGGVDIAGPHRRGNPVHRLAGPVAHREATVRPRDESFDVIEGGLFVVVELVDGYDAPVTELDDVDP